MSIDSLETPCLLLDLPKVDRNLAKMAGRAANLGVTLRPHLKTAKALAVAERALALSSTAGIAVSTLREAEFFSAGGYRDVFYAVGIEPGKLARAARLLRQGVALTVATHDLACAHAIAQAGEGERVEFAVLIEIDSGAHRGGVAADADELIRIGRALHRPGSCRLAGVFTHGGHSYAGRTTADHKRVADEECRGVTAAAARLLAAGLPCDIVSMGSTPTARWAESISGVTELRAGVYMFGDLFQLGIGAIGEVDLALTVLAAVIGHQPSFNRLLIDAGALALSDDRSTAALEPGHDWGYGCVCDRDGRPVEPRLFVHAVSQEHGWVTARGPIDFSRFPIGTRVRVQPIHACSTAACHDRYHVLNAVGDVTEVWPRCNRW